MRQGAFLSMCWSLCKITPCDVIWFICLLFLFLFLYVSLLSFSSPRIITCGFTMTGGSPYGEKQQEKDSGAHVKDIWLMAAAQDSAKAGLKYASDTRQSLCCYSSTDHQFSSLLDSAQYCDLTIICGSRTWRVHRNIIGPRCDFFGGCLKGAFKVGRYF